MSTEQERSFIARIRYNGDYLGFLQEKYILSGPQPNLLTSYDHEERLSRSSYGWSISGGLPDSRAFAEERVGQENLHLEMIVYFRCYENYYNIQIRNRYFLGQFFSKSEDGSLGAFPPAGGNTTSYNLLDANLNIITLDDIETDEARVYFKARNAGLINSRKNQLRDPGVRKKHQQFNTFGDHSGTPAQFELKILERNVPYPTKHVPYT